MREEYDHCAECSDREVDVEACSSLARTIFNYSILIIGCE